MSHNITFSQGSATVLKFALISGATSAVLAPLVLNVSYVAGAVFGASCGVIFPLLVLGSNFIERKLGFEGRDPALNLLKILGRFSIGILAATALTAKITSVALPIFMAIPLFYCGKLLSLLVFALISPVNDLACAQALVMRE